MDADDQHFLVTGSIQDADPCALGEIRSRAPQEGVLQFHAARVLEAEHLTALRIGAGHDLHDRAVFACGAHGLEHQKDGIAVGDVEKLLLRTEASDMVRQQLLVLLPRFVHGVDDGRPFSEVDIVPLSHAELF